VYHGLLETGAIVIKKTNISGVSISSLFHYNSINNKKKLSTKLGNLDFIKKQKKKKNNLNIINELKKFLKKNGVNLRYEKN